MEQASQVMAHGGAHQVDGIDRADVVRLLVPAATLEQLRAMYGSAASRLNRSAWVQLFQSRFMGALGNRSRQMAALLAAERRSPALDVAFLIFQVRSVGVTVIMTLQHCYPAALRSLMGCLHFVRLLESHRQWLRKACYVLAPVPAHRDDGVISMPSSLPPFLCRSAGAKGIGQRYWRR